MDDSQIREHLLKRYGLRVQPEMRKYLADAIKRNPALESIAVMGGNARTGVAVRQLVAAKELLHESTRIVTN